MCEVDVENVERGRCGRVVMCARYCRCVLLAGEMGVFWTRCTTIR